MSKLQLNINYFNMGLLLLYYMCVGERDIVNCRFLIYSTCNFAIPGTSIAVMREREGRPDSGKHLSLKYDQAHKLVV